MNNLWIIIHILSVISEFIFDLSFYFQLLSLKNTMKNLKGFKSLNISMKKKNIVRILQP